VKKRHKIRRYNKIYGGRGFHLYFTPIQIAILIVGLITLFAVGWTVAKAIGDRIENPPTKEELLPEMNEEPKPPQNEGEDTNVNEPENVIVKDLYKHISVNVAQDTPLLQQFISEAKNQGVNKVIFNGKDSNGLIHYNTSNPKSIQSGAVATTVDISNLNKVLSENGLGLVVSISAFKDNKIPLKFPETSVKYKNTQSRWLDNFANSGGKPWLDPSNPVAQSYITEIIDEIYNLGINDIIVNDFNYPNGVIGLNLANFTSGKDPTAMSNAINGYMGQLQTMAAAKGKDISFNIPLNELMAPTGVVYGANIIKPTNAVVDLSQGLASYNVIINNQPVVIDVNGLNTQDGKVIYYTQVINQLKAVLGENIKLTVIMLHADQIIMKDKIQDIDFIIK